MLVIQHYTELYLALQLLPA